MVSQHLQYSQPPFPSLSPTIPRVVPHYPQVSHPASWGWLATIYRMVTTIPRIVTQYPKDGQQILTLCSHTIPRIVTHHLKDGQPHFHAHRLLLPWHFVALTFLKKQSKQFYLKSAKLFQISLRAMELCTEIQNSIPNFIRNIITKLQLFLLAIKAWFSQHIKS